MAESLPSSVSAFSHRRARRRDRADSIASFTYYNEPGGLAHGEGRGDEDERYGEDGRASDFAVSVADEEELDRRRLLDEGDGVIDFVGDGGLGGGDMAEDEDLDERGVGGYAMHRRPSTQSVRARLLGRRDSTMTEGTASNFAPGGGRCVQKLHMANEDLTIAIAGFRTSRAGMAAYVVLCVATLGVAYLLLRWLPRWYVRLVGRVAPLRDCEWVVVENEWGELALLDVDRRPYGRPLSTVFGIADKLGVYGTGEDPDPILVHLIMINYRCTRFYFHPDRDKFVLCAGWKDPSWIDVYAIRSGIDADEKSHREAAFGRNLVDIEEPPIMKLLVDEVCLLPSAIL